MSNNKLNSGNYRDTGLGFKAFYPNSLQDIEKNIKLDSVQDLLDKANIALGQLTAIEMLLPNPRLITEKYAIKEALLSSQIEGTQSTLAEVYENQELKQNITIKEDIREVNNYFEALNFGIDNIKTGKLPLSFRLLKECHKILMNSVRGGEPNKTSGEYRNSQNWIGGNSPKNAYFVPPPTSELMNLLGELERYMYYGKMPHLIKLALIHYQFETIHPFLDGNGRIGRLIIPLYLISNGIINYPTLYLSLYLKKHKMEYYNLLMDVRNNSTFTNWIKFFLEGIIEVSRQIMQMTKQIDSLEKQDRMLVHLKSEVALLESLFINPTTNIKKVKDELNVSNGTSNNLVKKFEELGILVQVGNSQRNKKYIYKKYLDIIEEEL